VCPHTERLSRLTDLRLTGAHPAHGRGRGLGNRARLAADTRHLVPSINESIQLGDFYTPDIGVVGSLRGGTIMRRRMRRVRTANGDVEVEVEVEVEAVVIARGVWSPRVARMTIVGFPR
jgi:glycine/D-amino acid oxidase-like deaminating enzyme